MLVHRPRSQARFRTKSASIPNGPGDDLSGASAAAVRCLAATILPVHHCVVVLGGLGGLQERVHPPRSGWLTLAVALLAVVVIPGCGTGTCAGDGPGVDNTLASAKSWVRVLSMPEGATGEGTRDVDFQVVPVDVAHREGSPRTETLAVPSSFLPGIEDALAAQDDVFLALASTGLEREMVAYVIVRGTDGSHQFVGECAQGDEEFLRGRLDGRYDATIDAVIGMTDRDHIKRTLSR